MAVVTISALCYIAPTPSHPNAHWMRFNEFSHDTFSDNTPLGDDVCDDSNSVECLPPVDACSKRASKRAYAYALQRFTLLTEKGFSLCC